jgi:hypothetical protein
MASESTPRLRPNSAPRGQQFSRSNDDLKAKNKAVAMYVTAAVSAHNRPVLPSLEFVRLLQHLGSHMQRCLFTVLSVLQLALLAHPKPL